MCGVWIVLLLCLCVVVRVCLAVANVCCVVVVLCLFVVCACCLFVVVVCAVCVLFCGVSCLFGFVWGGGVFCCDVLAVWFVCIAAGVVWRWFVFLNMVLCCVCCCVFVGGGVRVSFVCALF